MFKRLIKILKKAIGFGKKTSKKRKKIFRRKTFFKRTKNVHRSFKKRRRILEVKSRVKGQVKRIRLKKRPRTLRKKHHRPEKKFVAVMPAQKVLVGVVTHYFPKVRAAVVKLKKSILLGEPVWIKGKSTDFRQTVGSIEIDRQPICKARAGLEIGLEVMAEVRPGDCIYRSVYA